MYHCYQLFRKPKGITGSSDTLQYPMNLRKGPKDPYLPSLLTKEFCNSGHGFQLPSSLRRLQATPLLQTSLLLTTYPYLNDLKERDGVSATKTVTYFKIYF